MSSSRRKQSNPKPLKLEEESWEDGVGGVKPKSEPKEEESHGENHSEDFDRDTVDGKNNNNNSENEIENENEEEDHSSLHSSSADTDSHSHSHSHSHHSHNSKSSPEPQNQIPNHRDHARPKIKRISCSNNKNPGYDHDLNHTTNSKLPNSTLDPLQMMNNAQQLIQAGYLHLLPPDAARLLLIQSNLPSDLTAATLASLNSGERERDSEQQSRRNSTPSPKSSNNNNTSIVNNNNNNTSTKSIEKDNNSRGLNYICEPCGIRFSSVRTLEAHQTYYCASRKENDKDGTAHANNNSENSSTGKSGDSNLTGESQSLNIKGIKRELVPGGEDDEDLANEPGTLTIDEGSSNVPGETTTTTTGAGDQPKSLKTGKLYSCTHCSYSADKKVSLNRHMRIHSGSGNSSHTTILDENGTTSPVHRNSNNGTPLGMATMGEGIIAADRYCFDCEIQFSSLKTFKVHKQYYCSTRHVLKANPQPPSQSQTQIKSVGESQLSPHRAITPKTIGHPEAGLSLSPPIGPECQGQGSPGPGPSPLSMPQPFVVLPTNPVMIVPYCFIQGASLVPGSLVPSQNALVVLPNGSVQLLPGTHFNGNFTPGTNNNLNNLSPTPSTTNTNTSNPNTSTIFNDPKEVIRRIHSHSHKMSPVVGTTTKSSSRIFHEDLENDENDHEDSGLEENSKRIESPAIDLTLRPLHIVEEDEKENRRSFTPSIHSHSHSHSHSPCTIGSGGSTCSTTTRRTKRPSSTISSTDSCCTSPPAPGIMKSSRIFPVAETQNQNSKSSKSNSRKISPIPCQGPTQTQLPGGAILTSTPLPHLPTMHPNQSLAELLMSHPQGSHGQAEFLNENLLKLLPGAGDPASILASLPRDLAMTYLASLQQSISLQQQQQQQQQQKFSAGPQIIPSAPGAGQGQGMVKRGIWKCLDCEIVYYKHENYLVHKEQYCAFRNKEEKLEGLATGESKLSPIGISTQLQSPNQSPIQRKSPDSSTVEIIKIEPGVSENEPMSKINGELAPGPDSTNSKHPCLKCGVGFKTLDNLSAHQAFYCRAGISSIASATSSPVAPAEVIGENNNKLHHTTVEKIINGFGRCAKCKLSIPEEQMNLHRNLCSPNPINPGNVGTLSNGNSPSSGWKCPCCDTYSPTMAAAQKHLETHTGIRAFKCLICGYRGNTLRGMRTHIRMHFDKRVSDLQEGDYISCITSTDLDNNVNGKNGAVAAGGAASSSAAAPVGVGNGALTNTRRRNRVTLLG